MPKATYKITFSHKDIALSGKTAAKAAQEYNANLQAGQPAITEKQVVLLHVVERDFIEACLQASMKKHRKLGEMNVIADISATVINAETSFTIDQDDYKTYIADAVDSVEIQPQYTRLSKLFAQLSNPEVVKEEVPEGKSEGNKKK